MTAKEAARNHGPLRNARPFSLERSYPVPPARVFAAWAGAARPVVAHRAGLPIRVTDDALLTRLARAWAQKWDGQWRYQVCDGRFEHPGGGRALVFEVRPAKVLAFAKGRFGQTRYRFS